MACRGDQSGNQHQQDERPVPHIILSRTT